MKNLIFRSMFTISKQVFLLSMGKEADSTIFFNHPETRTQKALYKFTCYCRQQAPQYIFNRSIKKTLTDWKATATSKTVRKMLIAFIKDIFRTTSTDRKPYFEQLKHDKKLLKQYIKFFNS